MLVTNKVSYPRGEKSVDEGCLNGMAAVVVVETVVVVATSAAMATITAAAAAAVVVVVFTIEVVPISRQYIHTS